jgi:hypothetical protein
MTRNPTRITRRGSATSTRTGALVSPRISLNVYFTWLIAGFEVHIKIKGEFNAPN